MRAFRSFVLPFCNPAIRQSGNSPKAPFCNPAMPAKTVAVCEAQVPFVHGGAELHVRGLVAELRRRGYRAERVSVPFKWYPKEQLLAHAAAWRLVDLTESNGERIDAVVA